MDSMLTQLGLSGALWLVGAVGGVAVLLIALWAKSAKNLLNRKVLLFNALYAIVLGVLGWSALTTNPTILPAMQTITPLSSAAVIGFSMASMAAYVIISFLGVFVAEVFDIYIFIPLAKLTLARIGIR